MRRSLAWLLGAVAVFEFLKRRKPQAQGSSDDDPDPRAEELRRKLAESRSIVEERDEFEAAEPTVDQTEHAPDDPERRRRDVHESAREITARMREKR